METVIGGGEVPAFVFAPRLIRQLSQQPLQLGIAAWLGELQEIDPAALVEVRKFVVELHPTAPIPAGKDSGDLGADAGGVKKTSVR